MTTSPSALLASHRAAAARASQWLRAQRSLELKPTEALELVAQVLGAANWQTLHGQAKQGKGPRTAAAAPASEAPRGSGRVDAGVHEAFERVFATGHVPTDKFNFTRRGDTYAQDRIAALFEGYIKGRQCESVAGATGARAPASAAGAAKPVVTKPSLETRGEAAPPQDMRALPVTLKPGDKVSVENGRAEMLYRGKVVDVDGTRVRVSLPAADRRPFVFDLSSASVVFKDGVIYTAW